VSPREFEEAVAAALEAEGYETELGQYVHDYGVDVVAERGEERVAVQVKMYGDTSRRVNRETIMALKGAAEYAECTRAIDEEEPSGASDHELVSIREPFGPTTTLDEGNGRLARTRRIRCLRIHAVRASWRAVRR